MYNKEFNEIQRNTELGGINRGIQGINEAIHDKLFLELYGKEAYLEMVEKRKFRRTLITSGLSAFLIGFFGVGLYTCNWNINTLFERLGQIFFNIF